MKIEQFVEGFAWLSDSFEVSSIKLLNSHKQMSDKIADFSLLFQTFKTDIFTSILSITSSSSNPTLPAFLSILKEKLKKLQLHYLLRKKVRQLQSQSIEHSMSNSAMEESFTYIANDNGEANKLMNSVLLIESDLGMEEAENNDSRIEIADIVRRSMKSLEATPSRIKSFGEVSETSMHLVDYDMNRCRTEESNNENILNEVYETQPSTLANVKEVNESKETKDHQVLEQKQPLPSIKPSLKRKKTATSNNKGMFDNLIEESLETCFKK